MASVLTARHYAVRGAEFLSEYLLFRALTLVRARSLFVDLDDGLTPSATVRRNLGRGRPNIWRRGHRLYKIDH